MKLNLLRNTTPCEVDLGEGVALAEYLQAPEPWRQRNDPWHVRIDPADDLLELPAEVLALEQLAISFPTFTDGRGYSHARTLRQRHGYSGELIAVGDIRRDQVEFMRRAGIDTFELTGKDSVDVMVAALTELTRPTVDGGSHAYYSGAERHGS